MKDRILTKTGIVKKSMKKSKSIALGFKESFPDEIMVCGQNIPLTVFDGDYVSAVYSGKINGSTFGIEISRNDLKGIGLWVMAYVDGETVAQYENLDYYHEKLEMCIGIVENTLGE